MSLWHQHPGVRSGGDLTRGERAADTVRNRMGSWGFVGVFCAVMAAWMLVNRGSGPDPYPFILLNLALSTLAGIQGAILLIASKRADQVSSELAKHDYETNVQAARVIAAVHALTEEIHAATVRKEQS